MSTDNVSTGSNTGPPLPEEGSDNQTTTYHVIHLPLSRESRPWFLENEQQSISSSLVSDMSTTARENDALCNQIALSPKGVSGWLKVLDEKDLGMEESCSSELQHITFHAGDTSPCGEDVFAGETSKPRIDNIMSMAESRCSVPQRQRLRKFCLWSPQKIDDFIQCILNHADRFRNYSQCRISIWKEISKDMSKLGHFKCDKDECNKKWSNLYRTWKIVRKRPRSSRTNWEYYNQVSQIVKSMNMQKVVHKESSEFVNPQELLVLKLIKENQAHQESIRKEEEKFQLEVGKLNQERDELLADIKRILQLCKNKESSSSSYLHPRVVSMNSNDAVGNINDITSFTLLTLNNTGNTEESVYFLGIPENNLG